MNRPARILFIGRWLPVRLGIVALLAVLQSSPLLAIDPENGVSPQAGGGREAGVSWTSGGVGDEALDEMRKVSSAYNVHLMFTGRDGHYLAGIPFKLSRHNGQSVLSGVSEGPMLYLKLAPGPYQVAAEIDGAWQTRLLKVPAAGSAATLRFVARGD